MQIGTVDRRDKAQEISIPCDFSTYVVCSSCVIYTTNFTSKKKISNFEFNSSLQFLQFFMFVIFGEISIFCFVESLESISEILC